MSVNVQQGLQRGAQLMQALAQMVPQIGALITSADLTLGADAPDELKLSYIAGIIRDIQFNSGATPADLDAVMPAITVVIQQMMTAAQVQPNPTT